MPVLFKLKCAVGYTVSAFIPPTTSTLILRRNALILLIVVAIFLFWLCEYERALEPISFDRHRQYIDMSVIISAD